MTTATTARPPRFSRQPALPSRPARRQNDLPHRSRRRLSASTQPPGVGCAGHLRFGSANGDLRDSPWPTAASSGFRADLRTDETRTDRSRGHPAQHFRTDLVRRSGDPHRSGRRRSPANSTRRSTAEWARHRPHGHRVDPHPRHLRARLGTGLAGTTRRPSAMRPSRSAMRMPILPRMSQSGTGALLTPTDFTIDPKLFPAAQSTPTPSATPGNQREPAPGPTTTPPRRCFPLRQTILDWNYTIPCHRLAARRHRRRGTTWTTFQQEQSDHHDPLFDERRRMAIWTTRRAPPRRSMGIRSSSRTTPSRSLFRKAVLASSAAAWQQAMSELSASLAIITWERPDAARTLLATLGRNYPDRVLPARRHGRRPRQPALARGLQPLQRHRPATPTSATVVTAKPEKATPHHPGECAPGRRELGRNLLLRADATDAPHRTATPRPARHPVERLDRAAQPARRAPTTTTSQAATKTTNSVTIVESSSIIQPSDKISLPVTVRNDLDFPVEVIVTVRSPERHPAHRSQPGSADRRGELPGGGPHSGAVGRQR